MNRLLRCTSVWLVVACGGVVAQTRRINARETDASTNFPLPGLWHTHLHVHDTELYPTHPSRADKEAVFPLLIANGVTGVRDMSGGLEQIQQWRTSIELGDLS